MTDIVKNGTTSPPPQKKKKKERKKERNRVDCGRFEKKILKIYKRFKRTLFNEIKQDRKQIFERILFLKATSNTKTNK